MLAWAQCWGSVPEAGMTRGLRGNWFPQESCYSRDFGKGKKCQLSHWVPLAKPRVWPVLYHPHSCLGDAAKAEPGSCWEERMTWSQSEPLLRPPESPAVDPGCVTSTGTAALPALLASCLSEASPGEIDNNW